jgi:adenylosuccinate synthase
LNVYQVFVLVISQISGNGILVCFYLTFNSYFESRLRGLAAQMSIAYPSLNIDIDGELRYYAGVKNAITAMTIDTVAYVNKANSDGKRILVEGANATMLDLDFGTYPYVTSSNPSIGSVCTGLGVSPVKIGQITGIVKAYCTRVGEGPFPTELSNSLGEHLRKVGVEYGTTTGRPRRCGWIDIPQLRYANMINGFTSINLTKLDVLTGLDEVKIGVEYVQVGKDGQRRPIAMPSSLEVQYLSPYNTSYL